ncbi:MAG: hypothetical protein PHW96_00900 [Candidatus Nanoarchaeia archaeon]|nr:hypothetical protein [Candidatus Nanoarchaeia archaeon]
MNKINYADLNKTLEFTSYERRFQKDIYELLDLIKHAMPECLKNLKRASLEEKTNDDLLDISLELDLAKYSIATAEIGHELDAWVVEFRNYCEETVWLGEDYVPLWMREFTEEIFSREDIPDFKTFMSYIFGKMNSAIIEDRSYLKKTI